MRLDQSLETRGGDQSCCIFTLPHRFPHGFSLLSCKKKIRFWLLCSFFLNENIIFDSVFRLIEKVAAIGNWNANWKCDDIMRSLICFKYGDF